MLCKTRKSSISMPVQFQLMLGTWSMQVYHDCVVLVLYIGTNAQIALYDHRMEVRELARQLQAFDGPTEYDLAYDSCRARLMEAVSQPAKVIIGSEVDCYGRNHVNIYSSEEQPQALFFSFELGEYYDIQCQFVTKNPLWLWASDSLEAEMLIPKDKSLLVAGLCTPQNALSLNINPVNTGREVHKTQRIHVTNQIVYE